MCKNGDPIKRWKVFMHRIKISKSIKIVTSLNFTMNIKRFCGSCRTVVTDRKGFLNIKTTIQINSVTGKNLNSLEGLNNFCYKTSRPWNWVVQFQQFQFHTNLSIDGEWRMSRSSGGVPAGGSYPPCLDLFWFVCISLYVYVYFEADLFTYILTNVFIFW